MEIKHFIACVDTLRILPRYPQRSLLHDVRYSHRLPAGEEFPFVIDKICLFTRFYGAKGTHRFVLRVNWENVEGDMRTLLEQESDPLEFAPEIFVEDRQFEIFDIRVPGTGLLEFHLTSIDEPEIILAIEYLEVRES